MKEKKPKFAAVRGMVPRLLAFSAITLSLAALLVGLIACKQKAEDPNTPDTPDLPSADTVSENYLSLSGITLSDDGAYAYVSDETNCAVYKIEVASGSVVAAYRSEQAVHNVVVSGETVYALEGGLGGSLVALNTDLTVQGSVVTGHTPYDVVISGTTAYVANRFSSSVSVVDLSSMTEITEISVSREPESMTLVGNTLYIAGMLPEGAANESVVSANVTVLDISTNTVKSTIELVNGAGSVKDIIASPDGSLLYLSHIVARYTYPTTQLDGGWINTNAVTVIDTATDTVSYTFLLDELENGAGNPWGMAINEDGTTLYCAISGTGELMSVNLKKLTSEVNKVGKSNGLVSTKEEIVDYIPFAADYKTRLDLGGDGVRSIAYSNGKIYCAEYFTGDVKVVDADNFEVEGSYTIAIQPEATAERLGEMYWYDATICYQNWQSCNSCHPDARADGFNWDNLNDGLGTSKQAKSMLYSHRTPPVMVTGIRANAETAVAAGMKYICFNSSTSGVIENIDAYLKSLKVEQSPYLNDDGTLTELAEKGKELFESYQCSTCHPAPLYTDMSFHTSPTLKTGTDWEYRDFDTPTLVEIWRTAPWTYNGSQTDMKTLIRFFIEEQNLGGGTISDSDLEALAEYVLSIGTEGEIYGAEQIYNSDGTYNKLVAGTSITGMTIRQQWSDASDATVTLTLYSASGTKLGSYSGTVTAGKVQSLTELTFDTPIAVPSDLEQGAYYVVSIRDTSGSALATDLKIIY